MLRHYVIKSNDDDDDEIKKDEDFYFDDDALSKNIHYDYPFGHYCADKAILSRDGIVTTYAMVCVPELTSKWTETDQLIRYIVDPIFHAIAIISYFIVAIIYFVLPQLRNLVGNSISSMCLCLIISQCVSTIRIFKQFGNHINFLIIGKFMRINSFFLNFVDLINLILFHRYYFICLIIGCIFLAHCIWILYMENI